MSGLVGKLINPEIPSAKEYIQGKKCSPEVAEIINSMSTYCLDGGLCIYAFSVLFSAAGESTVVKVSTFIDHMRKFVKFQHEIVTSREERGWVLKPPRKLLLIDLTRRSNQVQVLESEFSLSQGLAGPFLTLGKIGGNDTEIVTQNEDQGKPDSWVYCSKWKTLVKAKICADFVSELANDE